MKFNIAQSQTVISILSLIFLGSACGKNGGAQQTPNASKNGSKPSYFLMEDQSLTVGWKFACAIKEDQTVACWGIDPVYKNNFPTNVKGFSQISAGNEHVCGLLEDGSVLCWGKDQGATHPPVGLAPLEMLTSGTGFTCGISKADHLGYCWGVLPPGIASPISPNQMTSLSASQDHLCGVRVDQSVECFGVTPNGKAQVPAGLSGVKTVSAGLFHTVVSAENGTLTAWGGSTVNSYNSVPVDVGNVGMVSSGPDITCGLSLEGVARCWGDIHAVGTLNNKLSQEPSRFMSLSVAHLFPEICGIKTDGQVACFGDLGLIGPVPADLGKVYTRTYD